MKKKLKVHTSSVSNEWETPQELFDALNAVFHFETDLAATDKNHKCKKYYTEKDDSLTKEWKGVCWINPPYGRIVSKFIMKAIESIKQKEPTTIVLLPAARVDTKWFQELFKCYIAICFIKGRLKFDNRLLPSYEEDGSHKKSSAPFPSAIILLSNEKKDFSKHIEVMKKFGHVEIRK